MTNKSNISYKYNSASSAAKSGIKKSATKSKKNTLNERNWYLADKLDHQRKISSISYYRSRKNRLRIRDELLDWYEQSCK